MLIEEGALERHNGGWVADARLSEVPIPDSVHGVIAARIDLLDANRATRCAAARSSAESSGRRRSGSTTRRSLPLGRRGLVSRAPSSSMAGMREFAFKHALTRDVAYGVAAARPSGATLHRRVAEWIQEVAPDRGAETAELAAYHYGRGDRLRRGRARPLPSARRSCS